MFGDSSPSRFLQGCSKRFSSFQGLPLRWDSVNHGATCGSAILKFVRKSEKTLKEPMRKHCRVTQANALFDMRG